MGISWLIDVMKHVKMKDTKNKNNVEIKKTSKPRVGILELTLSILIIIVSMYLIYTYSAQIKSLGKLGYLGAGIIAFLSSATVFIPGPGLLVIGSMSNIFNPILLAVIAGVGAGFGESIGYFSGEGLRKTIHKDRIEKDIEKYKSLIKKYGVVIILIFASFPNPLFDIIGIASGFIEIPKKTFLAAVISGNIVKYLMVCYVINLIRIHYGLAI